VIGTDAPSISHWALDVAPAAALTNIDAEAGFLAALSRRLKEFWPQLAKTVVVDLGEKAAGSKRRRTRKEVPIESLEAKSKYKGPSEDAVRGEEPDEG